MAICQRRAVGHAGIPGSIGRSSEGATSPEVGETGGRTCRRSMRRMVRRLTRSFTLPVSGFAVWGTACADAKDRNRWGVLPRRYPGTRKVVGATGFEPASPCRPRQTDVAEAKCCFSNDLRRRLNFVARIFRTTRAAMHYCWSGPSLGERHLAVGVLAPRRGTMDNILNATITVDAALKERLAELASQSGRLLRFEFVEALFRRIANADVRFDRGVPVFPRRPGAPTLNSCRR